MSKLGMTKEEVINKVMEGGGHIVILGAGASIAATLRNPEGNNKRLPSMENLISVVGLEDIVDSLPSDFLKGNFELFFSKLYENKSYAKQLVAIEQKIYSYFSSMRLPDEPTIYDYLVLSLRPKDLIASFNWDPFLYQAWSRNREIADSPYIAFLHGNVAIGYNHIDKASGPAGWYSKKTRNKFEPTQLLYPITKKNYQRDEYIGSQWDMFRSFLNDKNVKRISIFGYSAPDSDIEAINILKDNWFFQNSRDIEDIEIIDVKAEKEIRDRWNSFIPSKYYSFKTDFFSSVIAHNPRRTSESHFLHSFPLTVDEAFAEANPVPKDFKTMPEMWKWYKPLIEAEKKHKEMLNEE